MHKLHTYTCTVAKSEFKQKKKLIKKRVLIVRCIKYASVTAYSLVVGANQ